MKTLLAERLCAACDLGTLLTEPQAVTGGLLHRMWRLSTTKGIFAIKQLNPAIMCRPGILDAYRLTEQIAADFAAQGIPAVAALTCHGDRLQHIDDHLFIVYTWIEGEVCFGDAATPEQARLMGSILAQIHALRLHYPEFPPLAWMHFHDDDWDILTFQAADMGLPWANPIRAVLPRLLTWSRWYEQAGDVLSQTLVISHRDLDQRNVIWQDARTPRLVDWEAAGLINPTMELVGLALHWSGQMLGEPQEDIFASVMEGYTGSGGSVGDPGIVALHGFMGTWLGWLLFNMRRSLGESVANEEERQLGMHETTSTLRLLLAAVARIEAWATWVDKWR